MAVGILIPAISREVEFLALHGDEADEIWEGNIDVTEDVLELLNEVNDRAERNILQLLTCVQSALDIGLRDLLRISWVRISPESWALRGVVYMSARGPKKNIGLAGFYIECNKPPRLIGWTYPRGGLDGRRELARVCGKTMDGIHLASDHRDRYDWASNDDAVIWLDEKLTKRARDQLTKQVERRAKLFFKIAKPTLKTLAGAA
jgi:hypothetical protein